MLNTLTYPYIPLHITFIGFLAGGVVSQLSVVCESSGLLCALTCIRASVMSSPTRIVPAKHVFKCVRVEIGGVTVQTVRFCRECGEQVVTCGESSAAPCRSCVVKRFVAPKSASVGYGSLIGAAPASSTAPPQ